MSGSTFSFHVEKFSGLVRDTRSKTLHESEADRICTARGISCFAPLLNGLDPVHTMTFASHESHHNHSPAPDSTRRFVASDLAHGDVKGLASLLAESLPWLAAGRWRAFDTSTKVALANLGLIIRPPMATRFITTFEFDALYRGVSRLSLEDRTLAIQTLLAAHESAGGIGSRCAAVHIGDLSGGLKRHELGNSDVLVANIRKLLLHFAESKNLGNTTDTESLWDALEEREKLILLSRAVLIHFTTSDPQEQQQTQHYLSQTGRHNDVPFLDSPQFQDARLETRERSRTIITRAMKHGLYLFDRLSIESRRPHAAIPCLLQTFGKEAFEDCRRIHSTNNERTPGAGFYLSGPRPDKLFFDGHNLATTYSEAYGTYGKALGQFADATFIAMRGGIIVLHRGEEYRLPTHELTDQKGNFVSTEPYALFIANDHFAGSIELAALLPVKVIQKYIMPSLELSDRGADDPPPIDVSIPGFNLEALAKSAFEIGAPPLMLANISTAFGGMVAAYPKGSTPYYLWEPEREKASSIWQDAMGRVHHAWYVRSSELLRYGMTQMQASRLRIEMLRPLVDGCNRVATAAEGLLNLLDLFMFRYDAWKCDLTPQSTGTPRMLREALHWHHSLKAKNAPESAYPILCKVDRYDWSAPAVPLLDTCSLETSTGDGKTRLLPSSLERGEIFWKEYVTHQFTNLHGGSRHESNQTLVFLPRNLVV